MKRFLLNSAHGRTAPHNKAFPSARRGEAAHNCGTGGNYHILQHHTSADAAARFCLGWVVRKNGGEIEPQIHNRGGGGNVVVVDGCYYTLGERESVCKNVVRGTWNGKRIRLENVCVCGAREDMAG